MNGFLKRVFIFDPNFENEMIISFVDNWDSINLVMIKERVIFLRNYQNNDFSPKYINVDVVNVVSVYKNILIGFIFPDFNLLPHGLYIVLEYMIRTHFGYLVYFRRFIKHRPKLLLKGLLLWFRIGRLKKDSYCIVLMPYYLDSHRTISKKGR